MLAEDLRQRMVEDLLLLTKIDEGTLALRRSQVDLDDIVLAEATRLRAADTGIRVDTRAVSACRVLGDEAHLERLVRNLTDNAIRHARRAITVSLYQVGDDAVLIDDDGSGVPMRDQERIFERFERLDEARDRDSGGTGLGLAIVREIANAHRGTVTVSDAPTGGARFEVTIPLDTQGRRARGATSPDRPSVIANGLRKTSRPASTPSSTGVAARRARSCRCPSRSSAGA